MLAAAAAAAGGGGLEAAVARALAAPGARVEVLEVAGAPPRCAVDRAEAAPPRASGRVAVRLRGADAAGAPCEAWAWARVRVSAPTLVTARAVPAGAALDGAVALEEREVASGRSPLTELPDGATAARALPAGAPLEAGLLRVGPSPGEPVVVAVRLGDLAVEQAGRALPCRGGRACALLPTGRRVEGRWHGGRIVLDSP